MKLFGDWWLLVSYAAVVNAHTVITYPGWRGNNLDNNATFPYGMQRSYPCEFFILFLRVLVFFKACKLFVSGLDCPAAHEPEDRGEARESHYLETSKAGHDFVLSISAGQLRS